ncbi:MAG TPA: DegT/DnrJ/EryC1/StrS family aminotransferase [Desulfomonilaceae bacterium]|nr:DegT/DnrJ/EryC1/StrS family aminotransferase [Desulfomonilaceae bacterium]
MTNNPRKIEFFRHSLGPEEKAMVLEALDGVFLTTGEYTARFEQALASYLGVREVVALDSCTAALHLTLLALGIGPGDEVITTPLTFVATLNAIVMCGATPVLADVDPFTGNLDPRAVEKKITARTKALMPVHLYGLMCDMKAFAKLAERNGLFLVEDSAHCIEAARDGVRPGGLSTAACLSFYATKNITCGEGGAVATNDTELANKIRTLSLHGLTRNALQRHNGRYEHWDAVCLGWKYNMDNIRASLLIPQIAKMDQWKKRRSEISKKYEASFAGTDRIRFPFVQDESWSARHLFTVWVDPAIRDSFIHAMQDQGIGVVVNYRAAHLLSYYGRLLGHRRGDFPHAEHIGDSTVSLPLYPGLADDEADYVIEKALAAVNNAGEPCTNAFSNT